MNEHIINLIKILLLTFIIIGAITFLLGMIYWDEPILYISLVQLMVGSVGYYLIMNNPKNSPIV